MLKVLRGEVRRQGAGRRHRPGGHGQRLRRDAPGRAWPSTRPDPPTGPRSATALENLKGEYKGLIKTYKRPFTAEQHDALTDEDYVMVVWKGGKIVPVSMK